MKRLMMVAALAVAQSGCVDAQGDAPVVFANALELEGSPGGECTTGSRFISQGSLDVSGGGNYVLAMQVRNAVPNARPVIIGDTPTTVGGGNVTLTEYVYRYEAAPELGIPEEESISTYAVLLPATGGDSYVFVNAFGPQALDALRKWGETPRAELANVVSYVKARGRLGSSRGVESNEFSFPVRVYSTGFSGCPAGFIPTGGICNPGQDGPILCVPETPPTTP